MNAPPAGGGGAVGGAGIVADDTGGVNPAALAAVANAPAGGVAGTFAAALRCVGFCEALPSLISNNHHLHLLVSLKGSTLQATAAKPHNHS